MFPYSFSTAFCLHYLRMYILIVIALDLKLNQTQNAHHTKKRLQKKNTSDIRRILYNFRLNKTYFNTNNNNKTIDVEECELHES